MAKKELIERRNDIKDELNKIVALAESENRPLNDVEKERFDSLMDESDGIRDIIDRATKVEDMGDYVEKPVKGVPEDQVKAFADYIRAQITGAPIDADANITTGDNGAVIPTSIANKIIEVMKDISPIFASTEKYNVKGNLVIPYIKETDDNITMAYADEFVDLEAKAFKTTGISLAGHLAGVLVKVSRSLLNNSDFDLAGFVANKIAASAVTFYEHEALIGTTGKATGLSTATQIITTASATAITVDNLIDVQDEVSDTYQRNAYWIMHKHTRNAIRKLKDSNGNYLLNPDIRNGFGYTLLGNPVYASDQMPEIATGVKTVYYGDYTAALATQMVEQFEVQVLNEKFATQHATGIVGWTEFDCKLQNAQAVSVLKMA